MRKRKKGMSGKKYGIMRRLAGAVCGILIVTAIMFGTAVPVMALEYVLPVTQTISVLGGKSANADDITITYKLTGENGAAMPNEATGNEYTFSIDGNLQEKLIFHYRSAGTYSYILERADVSGVGGGMIDGNPIKIRIVNRVNEEDFTVKMVGYILEGTYDVGNTMTDCSFEYKCAIRGAKKKVPPDDSSVASAGSGGDGAAGGAGGGSNGGAGGGSGGNGNTKDGNKTASNVKTGDESNAVLYLVMMAAAVSVVLGMRRRHS